MNTSSDAQAVFDSIARGDCERLRILLDEDGERAVKRNDAGIRPLMWSLYHQQQKIVDALLEFGVEPDFFEAAAIGRIQRVRDWLAVAPELTNGYSPDGFTALHLACYFDQPTIVSLLVERGADVNVVTRNKFELRPIHSAAAARSSRSVQLLLEYGAEPNAQQQGGYAPLHSAAKNGDFDVTRSLILRNADPTLQADDGKTPRDLARESGHDRIVQLLGPI